MHRAADATAAVKLVTLHATAQPQAKVKLKVAHRPHLRHEEAEVVSVVATTVSRTTGPQTASSVVAPTTTPETVRRKPSSVTPVESWYVFDPASGHDLG